MRSFLMTTALVCSMATSSMAEGPENFRNIDLADAGTTAIGLASGLVEANPLASWAGDGAPIVVIGLKYLAKRILIASGVSKKDADYRVGIGSAFGVGNNIAILVAGTNPIGLVAGAFGATIYADMNRPGFEKSREPQFQKNWHGKETR